MSKNVNGLELENEKLFGINKILAEKFGASRLFSELMISGTGKNVAGGSTSPNSQSTNTGSDTDLFETVKLVKKFSCISTGDNSFSEEIPKNFFSWKLERPVKAVRSQMNKRKHSRNLSTAESLTNSTESLRPLKADILQNVNERIR